MIGKIISNYKIEEKIGEGGMGSVYRGVDTMLDREVAIKALKPELASQDSLVERFRTEAVTLAKLNHPNVATLFSMLREGDELYMVLEFVRGETLDNILKRRGALSAAEAIPVFCQVLDGIDHAHELGIVHRDIKPANMMLTEKGTLKVLDFGISRLLGSARMTRAGNIIGTLEYMAPEQVRGMETDSRSDIYALGMMLYEVLTGKLPFDTKNEFELMKLQTEELPQFPREVNPDIPEVVEEAIMRAIRKEPNERFQSAREFCEMLLNAGFEGSTAAPGLTGSMRRAFASKPPISKPSAISAEIHASLQETRITGSSEDVPVPESELHLVPTRISTEARSFVGNIPDAADAEMPIGKPDDSSLAASPSFFSRFGVTHYIAAGVIVILLIGGAVALPFMLLAPGTSASNTEVRQSTTGGQSEEPAASTLQQTSPEVVPPLAQPASPAVPEPPIAAPVESPKADVESRDEADVERRGEDKDQPAKRPPPATLKKPAAPPPTRKSGGCTTERRLTGQCI